MQKLGIWMDKDLAHIVSIGKNGEEPKMRLIESNMDYIPIHGIKEEKGNDRKRLERENHQFLVYFRAIVPAIRKADNIVIFGPAECGKRFYNFLKKQHPEIHQKVLEVQRADSMSNNQIVALVRDYFD